jgi:parvulin-like peptidyl-prolyl isomerase
MAAPIKAWLREPLVHFILAGALIYAGASLIGGEDQDRNDVITISQKDIARLQSLWEQQYAKPPTQAELSAIIDQHIREEVLFREATKIGLGEDDVIVRRRLAQKFLFFSEGLIESKPPSPEELDAYFADNKALYQVPMKISFRHIYFQNDRPEPLTQTTIQNFNTKSQQDPDWRQLGDPFMLPREFAVREPKEIADLFGKDFADALPDLPAGQWTGPISSAYGQHAVMIVAREPAHTPPLDEISDKVSADFVEAQRQRANEELYQNVLAQYVVVVEEAPQ